MGNYAPFVQERTQVALNLMHFICKILRSVHSFLGRVLDTQPGLLMWCMDEKEMCILYLCMVNFPLFKWRHVYGKRF